MRGRCEEKQPINVGAAVGVLRTGVEDSEDDAADSARVKMRAAVSKRVIIKSEKASYV